METPYSVVEVLADNGWGVHIFSAQPVAWTVDLFRGQGVAAAAAATLGRRDLRTPPEARAAEAQSQDAQDTRAEEG